MTEVKYYDFMGLEEPSIEHTIEIDRFEDQGTRICYGNDWDNPRGVTIPDRVVVQVALDLLSEGAPQVTPDTTHVKHSTNLKFESYHTGQMGHGFVGYKQSAAEKEAGVYDAHTVLIHQNAENEDLDVKRVVANECAMLAYLLNKFRFDNSFISEHAKSCAVGDH